MFQSAMEAADYVIASIEATLDRSIGRELRLACGRYAAVIVIGVPIAWAVPGFHWERVSTFGLLAGLVLYACVDIARQRTSARRRRLK